jgi:hypothetical protein
VGDGVGPTVTKKGSDGLYYNYSPGEQEGGKVERQAALDKTPCEQRHLEIEVFV